MYIRLPIDTIDIFCFFQNKILKNKLWNPAYVNRDRHFRWYMLNYWFNAMIILFFPLASTSFRTIISQTAWQQARIFTQRFLNRYRLNLQHQWFCISNRKPTNTLTNRIQCAFDEYFFEKQVDSNIAPKTRAIIHIHILFYLNNAYM